MMTPGIQGGSSDVARSHGGTPSASVRAFRPTLDGGLELALPDLAAARVGLLEASQARRRVTSTTSRRSWRARRPSSSPIAKFPRGNQHRDPGGARRPDRDHRHPRRQPLHRSASPSSSRPAGRGSQGRDRTNPGPRTRSRGRSPGRRARSSRSARSAPMRCPAAGSGSSSTARRTRPSSTSAPSRSPSARVTPTASPTARRTSRTSSTSARSPSTAA